MPKSKEFFKYTEAAMQSALSDVRRGLPIATAAKKYGVPRITLMYKVKGKTPEMRKMGRESYLSKEEEGILVSWILKMSKVGFPIGKEQLLDSVQHLMIELKRDNPFTNNRPGKKWYASFLRRNPDISPRTAQHLTISRASVTTKQLESWFNEIYTYLTENNYIDILNDPERIFNADETAFFLNPKGDKVLAARGEKSIYKVINSDEKECLTVLISGNANGDIAPPMVIFRYERIPRELAVSVPPSWGIGKSESGWMTGETFFEFISNIFYPWVVEKRLTLPVILFIDGHSSHLTLHVSQFCEEHKIILIALFPNSTHLIQPMDVAVFRTLKAGWKENVQQWRLNNYENPVLRKIHFCPLLKKTLEERLNCQILQNGFRKCGLFPWNPKVIQHEENTHQEEKKKGNLLEIIKGLTFVEKYIEKEKIYNFKSSTTWNGNVADLSLFEFYRKILKEKEDLENKIEVENQEVNKKPIHPTEIICTTEDAEKAIENNTNVCIDVLGEAGPSENKNKRIQNIQKLTTNDSNNIFIGETRPSESPFPRILGESNTTPVKETVVDNNVPTPFKKALFWPGPKPLKEKKYKKEKVPSVTTSRSWQLYYENKELKKKTIEEEKKKRLEERKKKREMKLAEKENSLKVKKDRGKRKRKESSDTTTEDEWESSGSSTADISLFENEDEVKSFIEPINIESRRKVDLDKIYKEGDYVVVSFPGKKRNLKFLCVIQEVLPNEEFEIVGMKKYTNTNKKIFILNETDVSTIEKSQIINVLPFPKMYVAGDRLKYEFADDLDVDA